MSWYVEKACLNILKINCQLNTLFKYHENLLIIVFIDTYKWQSEYKNHFPFCERNRVYWRSGRERERNSGPLYGRKISIGYHRLRLQGENYFLLKNSLVFNAENENERQRCSIICQENTYFCITKSCIFKIIRLFLICYRLVFWISRTKYQRI